MKLFVLALLIVTPFLCRSQGILKSDSLTEINSDLVDETEEVSLLIKGEVQMEAAYSHTKFNEGGPAQIIQTLLRFGLMKKVELRLLIEEGKDRDRYLNETVQSTSPMAFGIKYNVLKDQKYLPDLTLITYLKLPFSSYTKEQENYWSPIFLLAGENKIGKKFKVQYTGGAQQEPFGMDWNYPANGSIHYKPIEKLDLFVEYYGQFKKDENPQHNGGAGLTWQINNTFQFFLVAGTSLFNPSGNHFGSGGLALRL